jgi:hypothetical protein
MGAVFRGAVVVVVVVVVVDVVVEVVAAVVVVVEVVVVAVVETGLSRCDRPEDGGGVTTSEETDVDSSLQLVTSASAAITAPINQTRLAMRPFSPVLRRDRQHQR